MPFFTFQEIIDIIMMTVIVGFIFSDIFKRGRYDAADDPLDYYRDKHKKGMIGGFLNRFNTENFKYAVLLTAPAIILHELGHKFVAMAFGLHATFHAAYTWLMVGLAIKLLGFPYIFFVPAYVSFMAPSNPLNTALIAFAGPGVNLALWIGAILVMKNAKLSKKQRMLAALTKQVNMFLFIFNMLPFSIFDGAKVFSGLIQWGQMVL